MRRIERSAPTPPKRAVLQIGLEDVLLLGAPGGKTEILDASVHREFLAMSDAEARRVFKDVARDLCESRGEAWRNRFIEGVSVFERDRVRVELKGERVQVVVRFELPLLQAFGYCRPAGETQAIK